jgi:hypothetical protein
MDKKGKIILISFAIYFLIFLVLAFLSEDATKVVTSSSGASTGFSSYNRDFFFGVPLYIFFILGLLIFLIILSKDIVFFLRYCIFNISSNKRFKNLFVILSQVNSDNSELYIKETLNIIDTLILSKISKEFSISFKKGGYELNFDWDFLTIKDSTKKDFTEDEEPIFYIIKNNSLQRLDKKGNILTKGGSSFIINLKNNNEKIGYILIQHTKQYRASFIATKFYSEFFVIANIIASNLYSILKEENNLRKNNDQ